MPRSSTQSALRTHADRIKRFRFAVFGGSLAIAVWGLAYLPAKITAASSIPTISSSVKKPAIELQNTGSLRISFTGSPDLVATLDAGAARPTAMVASDFDRDGAPDLVIGYGTAGGGVIALLRGNPDAFAPKNQNLYQAAMRGQIPQTFVSAATVFRIPGSPDFMTTGDFNRDGYEDLLVGTKGGGLYMLEGDGRGNLRAPQLLLSGKVTAVAATSAGHVAVGTDGPERPRLVVFAPTRSGLTQAAIYALPAPATSIAWGALGGGTGTDLAIASGSTVVVIYSALSSHPRRANLNLHFHVGALAPGDFVSDRNGMTEIAVLGDDGQVRILEQEGMNTRPLTAADFPARQALLPRPIATDRWAVAKRLVFASSLNSGVSAQSVLQSPRLTVSPTHDLMILDAAKNQISIFDTSANNSVAPATAEFSSTPIAAYATPEKLDGERDLVVLTSAQIAPLMLRAGNVAVVNVNTTTDMDQQNACANKTIMPQDLRGTISLRTAVCAADNYGAKGAVTINVPAGTYQLTSLDTGELQLGTVPGSNISIIGRGTAANTIIQQTDSTDRVLNFDPNLAGNVTGAVSNVTVTGGHAASLGGGGMLAGFIGDRFTIANAAFTNNSSSGAGAGGGGIDLRGGSLSMTNCTITNNTANGNAGGGIAITNGAGSPGDVFLVNTVLTGNTATGDGSFPGEGGGVFMDIDASSRAIISGSTVTLNSATGSPGRGGGIFNQAGPLSVINSRIVGNQAGDASGIYTLGFDATAIDNWWGCNNGPGASGCNSADGVGGAVAVNPWLVLSISAAPTQIKPNGTSEISADLTHDSNGSGGFTVPNGTPLRFAAALGRVQPLQTILTNGIASSNYTAGATPGAGQAATTVDNQSVNAIIDIVQSATITSTNHTTFMTGRNATFRITTTGFPVATITESGTLPTGVTFQDNGDGTGILGGLPAAGTGGIYKITFTATNSVPPNAQQNFTLTIHQPPAITSADNTNFRVKTVGSFTVTTTGFPIASIVETGTLPKGVTFVDHHNGTGTLAGTPAAERGREYPLLFTATNGVNPRSIKRFTLRVEQEPAITSADTTNFQLGSAGSFTVTTTGFPTAGLYETGILPRGVQFVDDHNGAGTLSGIPVIAGTFSAELWAANNAGNTEQNFTLVVQKANTTTALGSATNPSSVNQNVDFSSTVSSSGTGIPTGQVKIFDGGTALGSASLDANGSAKLSINSLAAGTHSVTAVYSGDSNHAPSTSAMVRQVVTRGAQFDLTGNPNVLTVSAGAAAHLTITATGQNGFGSAVALACNSSTLPTGATCQFSPALITPGVSPATSALTISTIAADSAQARPSFRGHRPSSLIAIWLGLPGLLVSTAGLGVSGRKKILGYCLVIFLIAGCLLQSACGGGTSTSRASTITGTYHILVTGTANGGMQTTTITMNVL